MDLVLRAAVAFAAILLLTRIVGRRELSSMEPFDIILLVLIGDLVQQGVTQSDDSVTGMIVVLSVIGLLTVGTSFLSFRVPWVRGALEGNPIVLVEHGQIIERNLRRERVTREELAAEARQQQIEDVDDIRFAVLETNGRISFVPRRS